MYDLYYAISLFQRKFQELFMAKVGASISHALTFTHFKGHLAFKRELYRMKMFHYQGICLQAVSACSLKIISARANVKNIKNAIDK